MAAHTHIASCMTIVSMKLNKEIITSPPSQIQANAISHNQHRNNFIAQCIVTQIKIQRFLVGTKLSIDLMIVDTPWMISRCILFGKKKKLKKIWIFFHFFKYFNKIKKVLYRICCQFLQDQSFEGGKKQRKFEGLSQFQGLYFAPSKKDPPNCARKGSF